MGGQAMYELDKRGETFSLSVYIEKFSPFSLNYPEHDNKYPNGYDTFYWKREIASIQIRR